MLNNSYQIHDTGGKRIHSNLPCISGLGAKDEALRLKVEMAASVLDATADVEDQEVNCRSNHIEELKT